MSFKNDKGEVFTAWACFAKEDLKGEPVLMMDERRPAIHYTRKEADDNRQWNEVVRRVNVKVTLV